MTPAQGQGDKRMRLRYAGACRLCGAALAAGVDAVYERESKTVRCVECSPAEIEAVPAEAEAAPEEVEAVQDVAGASARAEYERRKHQREDRIRSAHPKLGGLILALSDDPQTTQAWDRGAVGEEMLAERLKDLPDSMRVLHDRRIPGSRANIDHIVVSPAGVWVIDAKRYKGKRASLHVEGGVIRPRVESLRVGGRDSSKLVVGVQSQVARVTAALTDMNVAVSGVLCFLEADWPMIGGSFTVNGVDVLWPRLLVKRISEASTASVDVGATHAQLAQAFPRSS